MNDVALAEGIYVKQSKGKLGGGLTSKECILVTLWFPYRTENGYVELLLVTEDLQSVLGIKETVTVDQFKEEYSMKNDSRDIYLRLKATIPR
jgi:hypothetical protein